MSAHRRLLVGLALGSGSARGWAHVGGIRAREQAGIRPDLVCGTSSGALVGAAYAAGELERLEQWVLGVSAHRRRARDRCWLTAGSSTPCRYR
jgi:NTE family protein